MSPSTHRLLTDVIADLTFSYGMEKGCEMLVDVWKKIKLPQESDYVSYSPNQALQTGKLMPMLPKRGTLSQPTILSLIPMRPLPNLDTPLTKWQICKSSLRLPFLPLDKVLHHPTFIKLFRLLRRLLVTSSSNRRPMAVQAMQIYQATGRTLGA